MSNTSTVILVSSLNLKMLVDQQLQVKYLSMAMVLRLLISIHISARLLRDRMDHNENFMQCWQLGRWDATADY